MWELDHKESWVPKNWCWRRLLRVSWTARRSNQSILKEISPECSLEGLMLKLKLQYFGHIMWRVTHWKRHWCWERLRAGEEGDNRGWDGWMASPTQWTWVWVNSRSWWWRGRPGMLPFIGLQRVRHNWATELKWRRDRQTYTKTSLLFFVVFYRSKFSSGINTFQPKYFFSTSFSASQQNVSAFVGLQCFTESSCLNNTVFQMWNSKFTDSIICLVSTVSDKKLAVLIFVLF